MKLISRQNLLEHWPLAIFTGFSLSVLLINPILEALGINSLEIHYRLFVIFLVAVITVGGNLWTALPLEQALLGLTLMTLSYYMYRKKWGKKEASGLAVLVVIIFLISIGKLKL